MPTIQLLQLTPCGSVQLQLEATEAKARRVTAELLHSRTAQGEKARLLQRLMSQAKESQVNLESEAAALAEASAAVLAKQAVLARKQSLLDEKSGFVASLQHKSGTFGQGLFKWQGWTKT